jgi:hypothetical protein
MQLGIEVEFSLFDGIPTSEQGFTEEKGPSDASENHHQAQRKVELLH